MSEEKNEKKESFRFSSSDFSSPEEQKIVLDAVKNSSNKSKLFKNAIILYALASENSEFSDFEQLMANVRKKGAASYLGSGATREIDEDSFVDKISKNLQSVLGKLISEGRIDIQPELVSEIVKEATEDVPDDELDMLFGADMEGME